MLNITQHTATKAQVADGVVEPSQEIKAQIQKLLTFDRSVIAEPEQIWNKAKAIVSLIQRNYPGHKEVMIGGALYLMPALVRELKENGYKVFFSYTDRVSEDIHNADGSVTKTLAFKHLGFVEL